MIVFKKALKMRKAYSSFINQRLLKFYLSLYSSFNNTLPCIIENIKKIFTNIVYSMKNLDIQSITKTINNILYFIKFILENSDHFKS